MKKEKFLNPLFVYTIIQRKMGIIWAERKIALEWADLNFGKL